jgi:hypothetical protein
MKTQQDQDNAPKVVQQKGNKQASAFKDERSETVAQGKLYDMVNNSPQVTQMQSLQRMVDNRVQNAPFEPIQRKENNTGLPDNLKTGMENLSGMSLDDVKVHRNSDKPAQLQAHAYAQGTDIHLGAGQEKHLPHEAWHVVQQKQGRVKPTMQMKGKVNVNDDSGLEREADVMGAKALTTPKTSQLSIIPSVLGTKPTIQRAVHEHEQEGKFYSDRDPNREPKKDKATATKFDEMLVKMGQPVCELAGQNNEAGPSEEEKVSNPVLSPGDVMVQTDMVGKGEAFKRGLMKIGRLLKPKAKSKEKSSGHTGIYAGSNQLAEAVGEGVITRVLAGAETKPEVHQSWKVFRSTNAKLAGEAAELANDWASAKLMDYSNFKLVKLGGAIGFNPARALKLGAYAAVNAMPKNVFCTEFVISCYQAAAYKGLFDGDLLERLEATVENGSQNDSTKRGENITKRKVIKGFLKEEHKVEAEEVEGSLNFDSQNTSPADLEDLLTKAAEKEASESGWSSKNTFHEKSLEIIAK